MIERDPVEHQEYVDRKRRNRMDRIDGLPADLRALVHDYGYEVVQAFLDHGVRRANQIRHLVETVLNAFSPTRGSYSRQGTFTKVDTHPAAAKLDKEHP